MPCCSSCKKLFASSCSFCAFCICSLCVSKCVTLCLQLPHIPSFTLSNAFLVRLLSRFALPNCACSAEMSFVNCSCALFSVCQSFSSVCVLSSKSISTCARSSIAVFSLDTSSSFFFCQSNCLRFSASTCSEILLFASSTALYETLPAVFYF